MKTCDVCDQPRPCVGEPVMTSAGIETAACHECRGRATCWECTDAYEQDRNDSQYDRNGNPR